MADKTVVVRAVYRSNVAQGMRQDAGAVRGLSANLESSAGKAANSTKALGAASAVAGKLMLLGIGGAMAVSAKAAIDFESSLTGVAKTTDLAGTSFERNSGPLFQFGEALRSLALRTPINVNELASIAELGGQLGIAVPNLVDFTEVMAELGVATNLTAQEAATGFARFANIMRTPQDEFRRLGSIVVELGNNLATTESEILKFATRIAPVARTVGATEEEVFALAGAMSSLGVPAERGGSAIQRWMITAKEAVDSGGESLDHFARVTGQTSEEFREMFRESPGEAFVQFARGLDNINESGGDLFGTLDALQLSNIRTTQALLAASGGADVLADSLSMSNEEGKVATASQEEAARRFGTTASQIQLLVNAFNDLRIEVGNAVLGSGGLAFAVDVAREFFGIIKDNLGSIQTLVTVAGGLVAIRLGVFFLQAASSAKQAIGAFKGTITAVQGMNTAGRLAQGGMLALTGAMQGLLGVAGLVAIAWVNQAINAAEARAEYRRLREEIEEGKDPLDAFTETLTEDLSRDQIRRLEGMGFAVRDLAQWLMAGKPAATEFGRAWQKALETPRSDPKGMELTGDMADAAEEAKQLELIVDDAAVAVENYAGGLRTELGQALLESGKAAGKTSEEIDKLIGRGIQKFGFDITEEEFLEFLNEAGFGLSAMERSARQSFASMRGEVDDTEKSWQQWLRASQPDEAGDIIEGFTQDNIGAVAEFREKMDEEFNRIGETIRSGMPVWGEYEQAVIGATDEAGNRITPTLREALRAQELFLEDTRDFVERMPDILEMGASADTVSWIEEMETPIRGAIGRLNDAQLQELIDGANANFDELQELHLQRWMQIYPDNANLAFGAMIGELANRVNETFPIGEHAMEAFGDGLMEMASQMPDKDREQFIGFLEDLLENEDMMYDLGFGDVDEGWIQGVIDALQGMADRVAPTIEDEATKMKNKWGDEFIISSPSKWFENLGHQMVAGLEIGLQSFNPNNLIPFDKNTLMPSQIAGAGTMSSVTNNRNANYNLTVNGGGNSNNINSEAQTLLTLLTIVGGVEQGAGK